MSTFSFHDMLRFATEAWGPLGTRTVLAWSRYNKLYFGGELRPIPLVITNTLPFGGPVAFCSHSGNGNGRTITVNVPKDHDRLLAGNGTLLHEMVHQHLFERGEDAGHDSEGWRREIMRLNLALTGRAIWAGRSKTALVDDKVRRINEPRGDGVPSLTQAEIAHWPAEDIRQQLGALGSGM